MSRIVKISKNDILFDRENTSDFLNKSASRTLPLYLSGGFETDDRIVLFLEDGISSNHIIRERYIIAPFSEVSEDGLIGEINSRYTAGFSIRFSFNISESKWGIFSQKNV